MNTQKISMVPFKVVSPNNSNPEASWNATDFENMFAAD